MATPTLRPYLAIHESAHIFLGAGVANSTEASAISAKSSLDKLLREAPFPIRRIQDDGEAEFKSAVEAECPARHTARRAWRTNPAVYLHALSGGIAPPSPPSHMY